MFPIKNTESAVNEMETKTVRDEAKDLLRDLPDQATWDDLMYRIYVRQAVESGVKDSVAGRTVDVKEVRTKFGLR